jgi:hypothetical protein
MAPMIGDDAYGSVKIQAVAILEPALLPQGLKLVVLLYRLLREMTRSRFMRCLGPLFILRLLLGFFIKHDALAGLVLLHCKPPVGNQRKRRSQVRLEPSGFPGFSTHHKPPRCGMLREIAKLPPMRRLAA